MMFTETFLSNLSIMSLESLMDKSALGMLLSPKTRVTCIFVLHTFFVIRTKTCNNYLPLARLTWIQVLDALSDKRKSGWMPRLLEAAPRLPAGLTGLKVVAVICLSLPKLTLKFNCHCIKSQLGFKGWMLQEWVHYHKNRLLTKA